MPDKYTTGISPDGKHIQISVNGIWEHNAYQIGEEWHIKLRNGSIIRVDVNFDFSNVGNLIESYNV